MIIIIIEKKIINKNKTIETLKSVKLLGLTTDNKLNFRIHINIYAKWLVRKSKV